MAFFRRISRFPIPRLPIGKSQIRFCSQNILRNNACVQRKNYLRNNRMNPFEKKVPRKNYSSHTGYGGGDEIYPFFILSGLIGGAYYIFSPKPKKEISTMEKAIFKNLSPEEQIKYSEEIVNERNKKKWNPIKIVVGGGFTLIGASLMIGPEFFGGIIGLPPLLIGVCLLSSML